MAKTKFKDAGKLSPKYLQHIRTQLKKRGKLWAKKK